MAPSAIDPPAQAADSQSPLPPPRLYVPKETHFEKYLDVQPDGYQQALSRGPERAMIIIDNGKISFPFLSSKQYIAFMGVLTRIA